MNDKQTKKGKVTKDSTEDAKERFLFEELNSETLFKARLNEIKKGKVIENEHDGDRNG